MSGRFCDKCGYDYAEHITGGCPPPFFSDYARVQCWGLPPLSMREGPWKFFQELKDKDFDAWSDYYGE